MAVYQAQRYRCLAVLLNSCRYTNNPHTALLLLLLLTLSAQWWGKSLLVTFGWAGFRLFSKVTRRKGATQSSKHR